ncbi:MAG: NIPSNAP family protein [Verrucomicrobiota bacterium]
MNIERRDFLKTTLAASATAALASHAEAAAPSTSATGKREYYELRAYKLKSPDWRPALEIYFEKAMLPALARRGIERVGVFTEIAVDKATATSKPIPEAPVWVLIPYSSLETFAEINASLNTDPDVLKAGGDYLHAKKASMAFDRIDSWLLRAFKTMPAMEVPAFAKNKVPTRVYEMRDYESHSELAALNKMAMFDEGEMEVMRTLGMSPVWFGQALTGPNLPHLRYFTGAPDLATHLANWKKFGPDPRWQKMKDDPKWADNTTRTAPARFLVPTACSQI